jgi:glycosyltransferase involved in cell wall biosynthesis
MKHIGILVNTLKSGGAEKQSIYLFNAIKDEYVTTFIVLHGDLIEDKLIDVIKGDNYNLILLKGNIINKFFKLYKLFKSRRITHLFTYLTKPNLFGSIIGRLGGVKYIFGSVRNSHLPKWKELIERISSLLSYKIIFNNHQGEKFFRKRGFKNTIVIPNCFYNIQPPYKRPSKKIVKIITVGRFVDQKDYNTCIDAILELKKINVNFICQIIGYGELEQQIRNKVKNKGLTNHIQIIINPKNINRYLLEADIYLSTSLFEGTSNSIMEAMNASLPIVATNVGDNNYLINEEKNGYLCEVKDSKNIALKLDKFIKDPSLRIKFGIESNKMLSENYSFKLFKDYYLKEII